MTEDMPPDMPSKVVSIVRDLRVDQLEREAIQAEANDRSPIKGKPRRVPPPPGVWEGSLREFNARAIEKPAELAGLGAVPVHVGAKVVLYGPPSSTKTLLAFRAALQVAIAGGTVWLLEGEGHEYYFRNRLNRLARGLSREIDHDAEERIRITHKPFVLDQTLEYWEARLAEWKPTLVVLDPLIDYSDANENDAKEMRQYLRLIQVATDQYNAAAIVCHHSGTPNAQGVIRERGSTAIKGWADTHIKVLADPARREPGLVVATAKVEKGRDSASQIPEATLRWLFADDTIRLEVESDEQPDEAPPSVPPSASERKEVREKVAREKRTERVLRLLAGSGGLSRFELRQATGWGGKQLEGALEPLFDAGRIHIEKAFRMVERRPGGPKVQRRTDVIKLGSAPAPVTWDPELGRGASDPMSETPQVAESADVSDLGSSDMGSEASGSHVESRSHVTEDGDASA